MCGIAGYVGFEGAVPEWWEVDEMVRAIGPLGGDAAGACWVDGDRLAVLKQVGTSEVFLPYFRAERPGSPPPALLLHARMATVGPAKVMANNHPLIAADGRTGLVHNGHISRAEVVARRHGFPFRRGGVDTQVLLSFIEADWWDGVSGWSELDGAATTASLRSDGQVILARIWNPLSLWADWSRGILFFCTNRWAFERFRPGRRYGLEVAPEVFLDEGEAMLLGPSGLMDRKYVDGPWEEEGGEPASWFQTVVDDEELELESWGGSPVWCEWCYSERAAWTLEGRPVCSSCLSVGEWA